MLRSLHIRNYVLIDALDSSFPEGLVIVTGQTGAGKSILLGALSLLTGAKADASLISEGAETCVVEAEFSIDDEDGRLQALLEEHEADWDGGRLLIRRTLSRTGRSRCFVNDSPVPLQVLSELSGRLVDIHAQHQSLLLTDRRFQLSLLDHYARAAADAQALRGLWKELSSARAEREELRGRLAACAADRSYNEERFRRLDEARLRAGELAELEAEQKRLAHAEALREDLARALGLLRPESDELAGPSDALREAERMLERCQEYIPALEELCARIRSSRIELDDLSGELEQTAEGVEVSEERLAQVDARLRELYDLMHKYGCRSEEELLSLRDRYAGALDDSGALEERLSELEKKVEALEQDYAAAASALHDKRAGAAEGFAADILETLRFLELDRAAFEVDLLPAEAGPSGTDAVRFRFSSDGSPAVDVARCASGGEISRIMLSLKAMMARYTGMPTLVFDEIDSGVSGSAADRMGSLICRMGEDMQVFAITHLPQVAAKGQAHYVVRKRDEGGRSRSGIERVEGEARVEEIARLLSGASVTPQAIANARVLLQS